MVQHLLPPGLPMDEATAASKALRSRLMRREGSAGSHSCACRRCGERAHVLESVVDVHDLPGSMSTVRSGEQALLCGRTADAQAYTFSLALCGGPGAWPLLPWQARQGPGTQDQPGKAGRRAQLRSRV